MVVYNYLFGLTLLLHLAGVWLLTSDPYLQSQSTPRSKSKIITTSYVVNPYGVSSSVSSVPKATGWVATTNNAVYSTAVGKVYGSYQDTTASNFAQTSFVAVTLKNLTKCLNTSHSLKFTTQNAVVDIRTKSSDKLPRLSSCEIQVTAPASMVFYINVLSINVQCPAFLLELADVGTTSRRLINTCDNDIPSELWSFTNVVTTTFVVTLESQIIQLALNFTAVPVTQRPNLEIMFTSPNRGYIQTPNWDGHRKYPVHMDSWVKVDIPEQSAIMVSVPHMDIEGRVPTICPADGLEYDCIGSEDEADCPYTSPRCGMPWPLMTWKEAFDFCLSQGARLASLNTPAEYNNVFSLLRLTEYGNAYVGMLQMFMQRPMYLNALQWTDGTIAYFKTIDGVATMPACGLFYLQDMNGGIKLKKCDEPRISHALCETEAAPGNQLRPEKSNPRITFLDISAWQNDSSKVVCPAGHMTHTFLSCDVASACWMRSSLSSCDAPLSSLPPAFDCDNGFDRVPHTLVCDHRSDCPDGSDEDFCEFASCYTSGKYDCGNHQVITFVVSANNHI
ncbi:hypothetical protein C0Q70_10545 [Pomacea canaliculata]|uniref:C-type lectin domain-containing protein n=1 Tax=Pomacea canaliculata TaxID=400727 RepID=A0A2T7P3H7_POMCA|nr:hypothetical protein C0Q70_10545 [Pomacea canaliculata]